MGSGQDGGGIWGFLGGIWGFPERIWGVSCGNFGGFLRRCSGICGDLGGFEEILGVLRRFWGRFEEILGSFGDLLVDLIFLGDEILVDLMIFWVVLMKSGGDLIRFGVV